MRPSLVKRPAFFAALARPFLRRMVVASSKFPFASSRAVLQFSMPAPVWSRSFFTSDALIVAIGVTGKKKRGVGSLRRGRVESGKDRRPRAGVYAEAGAASRGR